MSRWYDQHRVEKRLRAIEQAQLFGALTTEKAVAHLIRKNKEICSELINAGIMQEFDTTIVAPSVK